MRVADVRRGVGIIGRGCSSRAGVKPRRATPVQIDPKTVRVELQAAEAALAKAEAALQQASQHATRIETLTRSHAASQATNEQAIAALAQAAADRAARDADVARARLNLGYATIRAPISGIIGAALLSEGALVVQNESQPLATIQQLDSVYADFTQSVTELNVPPTSRAATSTCVAETPQVASWSTTHGLSARRQAVVSDAKVDATPVR